MIYKPVLIYVPMLGRLEHMIHFDFFDGYFQKQMAKDDILLLGVQTLFGGTGSSLEVARGWWPWSRRSMKEELRDGICENM